MPELPRENVGITLCADHIRLGRGTNLSWLDTAEATTSITKTKHL